MRAVYIKDDMPFEFDWNQSLSEIDRLVGAKNYCAIEPCYTEFPNTIMWVNDMSHTTYRDNPKGYKRVHNSVITGFAKKDGNNRDLTDEEIEKIKAIYNEKPKHMYFKK